MTTEKPLSEKEIKNLLSEKHPLFLKEDVAEAVKRLKQKIYIVNTSNDSFLDLLFKEQNERALKIINEIFGDLK